MSEEQQNQGYAMQPIVQQPRTMMATGRSTAGSAEGMLQYLQGVTMLQIRQKIEFLELVTGFETENKFAVLNQDGLKILNAAEESDCCARFCCGPRRPFHMTIFDNTNAPVVTLERPLACQSCCFPCCLMNMTVNSPPGNFGGSIEQLWSCIGQPRYAIKDATGNIVLYIEGPICVISCCSGISFKVKSAIDGSEVGEIRKKWSGFVQEAFTDADNFAVTFPRNLEDSIKVLLLGAVFLVDMMYFEKSK